MISLIKKCWKVQRLHDEIMADWNRVGQQNFDTAIKQSFYQRVQPTIELLDDIEKYWPPFLIHYKRPYLVFYRPEFIRANLLINKAWALEAYFNTSPRAYKRALDTYRAALKILSTAPEYMSETFFSAVNGYLDLMKQRYRELGSPARSEALMLCENSIDFAQRANDKVNFARSLAHLGEWIILTDTDKLSESDFDSARSYIEHALEIFKEYEISENIGLAYIVLHRINSLSRDFSNIEEENKYLIFLSQAIDDMKQANCSPNDIGLFVSHLGAILSTERHNVSKANLELSFRLLEEAYKYIEPDKYEYQGIWALNVSSLAHVALNLYGPNLHAQQQELFESLCVDIETAYNVLKGSENRLGADGALKSMNRFKEMATGGDNFDYLNELNALSETLVNCTEHLQISEWLDIQIKIGSELFDKNADLNAAAEVYKFALDRISIDKYPAHSVDLAIRLGDLYRKQNLPDLAFKYFQIAIAAYRVIKSGQSNYILDQIQTEDRLILKAPITAIEAGDIHSGLLFLEEILSDSLTKSIEAFALFQASRNYLYWVELYVIGRKEIRELLSLSEQQQNSVVDVQSDFATQYFKLKNDFPDLLHEYYLKNFDKQLQELNTWILLPFIVDGGSKLLIIPPSIGMNGAVVSELIDGLYFDLLELIIDPDFGLAKLNYDDDLYAQLSGYEVISEKLGTLLGHWVFDVVEKHPQIETKAFTVVSYGVITSFSLAMAYTSEAGQKLIDRFDMSYVPNLYTLITLNNRLKDWKQKIAVGFMEQTLANPILPYTEIERRLTANVVSQIKNASIVTTSLTSGTVHPTCRKSSYWHFASHGLYDPTDVEKSHIELNDGQLYFHNLSSFTPENHLRLVVLSGCQTGISDFIKKDRSPRSYLTEFFKSGAMGTIGTLWKVADLPAALLIGRFYELHFIESLSPASALSTAQKWLRDSTCVDFINYIHNEIVVKGEELEVTWEAISLLKQVHSVSNDNPPFQNPYYWAGFILMGL